MIAAMVSPTRREVRTPRWNRLEHAVRRRQILSCARRLFSERNYEAVSTAEIAAEAGVTRGLIYHYFGDKRGLYLEVVRSLFVLPADIVAASTGDEDPETAVGRGVDRWLEMAVRNRTTLLALQGAQGFGRDTDLEAIVDEARQRTADIVIGMLDPDGPPGGSAELRALVIAWAGFTQTATADWLEHGQLSRDQLRAMLVRGLIVLKREILPTLERLREARSQHPDGAIG